MPLFTLIGNCDKKIDCFFNGFLWGFLFFLFHFQSFFIALYDYTQSCFSFMYIGVALFYGAFCAGAWFLLLRRVSKKYNKIEDIIKVSLITEVFFLFIEYLFFFPFGWAKGYPFAFPLIIMVKNHFLLNQLLFFGNKNILLLLIIIFQSVVAYSYQKKTVWHVFLLGVVICNTAYFYKKNEIQEAIPEFLNYICFIPWIHKNNLPYEQCLTFCNYALAKIDNDKKKQLFIGGESFFSFDFEKQDIFLSMIQKLLLKNSKTYCILGAYAKADTAIDYSVSNSLFCFNNSRIIKRYDKKILLPFFEFLPKSFCCIRTLLHLPINKSFNVGKNTHETISIEGFPVLIPLVCADFFWLDNNNNDTFDSVICALINDSFFRKKSFFLKQMLFLAQFIAISKQKDVLYIGSYQAFFLTKKGSIFSLNS